MSGLATIWTAALWRARPWGQEPDDLPYIGVVNRGAKTAHVEVTWFNYTGTKIQKDDFDLEPKQSSGSALTKAKVPASGWARIVSDQPVAPWGVTPHHLYVRIWANIEFYPENVVPLEEVYVPLGKIR